MMVSIIIPAYNAENTLPCCLDSLLNQTYADYEIIVVDDGSTDKTGRIAEKYADINPKIKVFHKANGGSASARNYGINKSSGSSIAFTDADDIVDSFFLEILMEIQRRTGSQICQCGFRIVKNHTTIKVNTSKTVPEEKGSKTYSNLDAVRRYMDYKTYFGTVVLWNKIFDRKLFDEIRFVEGKSTDDEYIMPRLLYSCNSLTVSDIVLYNYVLSDNSQMRSSNTDKKVYDVIDLSEYQLLFFQETGNQEFIERSMAGFYGTIVGQLYYFKKRNKTEEKRLYEKYKTQLRECQKVILKSRYVPFRSKALLAVRRYVPGIFYSVRRIYRWRKER